ncbi:hypothetical protein [Candidatus Spongiihabitans sp.]|uniref:hypothetical protein n=1 Tax=Candidatus Spongiihabitans sp. TaxID=3101308 RepID=UPI003C7B72DD
MKTTLNIDDDQPQASIAFAEIHSRNFVERPGQSSVQHTQNLPCGKWKTPPADWNNPDQLI